MSFDWINYLSLAEELSKTPNETPNKEATSRAAISRAYYAAFKKAEEFVVRRDGFVVQKPKPRGSRSQQDSNEEEQNLGSSHVRVIRQFTRQGSNQYRIKIGVTLRRIKHHRESADYDADYDGNIDEALNETLIKAKEIISKLKVAV
ncbi:MAG: hypothetical protein J0I20_05070 [Chloroflexi bacterium]|nr:hypothetical protein [Chloroflexota bacterium]OJV97781.1 MAG: hypothetical protein BGO39_07635 [Chloroflexi bacterium 54-19]